MDVGVGVVESTDRDAVSMLRVLESLAASRFVVSAPLPSPSRHCITLVYLCTTPAVVASAVLRVCDRTVLLRAAGRTKHCDNVDAIRALPSAADDHSAGSDRSPAPTDARIFSLAGPRCQSCQLRRWLRAAAKHRRRPHVPSRGRPEHERQALEARCRRWSHGDETAGGLRQDT